MSKVALVTDSTACIPEDLMQKYQISVAPQILVWGEETFLDGVDIQPDQYYIRLQNAKIMPTTSQASPKSFNEIFSHLLDQGLEVLTILLSAQLSGTLISAQQALENFPGAPIEIMDSYTTAMAMGFQVLAAARAAEQGGSLIECKAIAEEARQKTGVIFAVDTLEFLHRGGRIGGGARLLGTALNLKPIFEISGGQVEPVEKVRTRKKSISRLLELVEERIAGKQPVHLATLHANAPQEACQIMEMVNARFKADENLFTVVSPVVGTHAGPGTVGIAYMAGM
jgi:DegV family protein with EDD domain